MSFAEIGCEQSRLVFNGPVGCSSNWQGFSIDANIIQGRDSG